MVTACESPVGVTDGSADSAVMTLKVKPDRLLRLDEVSRNSWVSLHSRMTKRKMSGLNMFTQSETMRKDSFMFSSACNDNKLYFFLTKKL